MSETQYIKLLVNNIDKGIFSSPHTNSGSLYLLVKVTFIKQKLSYFEIGKDSEIDNYNLLKTQEPSYLEKKCLSKVSLS